MIKIDIEMPIYCYDCPCHNGENGRCQISGDFTADKRPFDCPLQELKHAHWEGDIRLVNSVGCAKCSYCGHIAPVVDYCGICGARMDEEEEDDKS